MVDVQSLSLVTNLDEVLGLLLDRVHLVLEHQLLAAKERDIEVLPAVASSQVPPAKDVKGSN